MTGKGATKCKMKGIKLNYENAKCVNVLSGNMVV